MAAAERNPIREQRIRGDAHVHLHAEFDRVRFLATAVAVAEKQAGPLLLLLAECAGVDGFGELRARAERGDAPGGYELTPTGEANSVAVARRGKRPVAFLVAGRQLVSRERIEVLGLALGSNQPVAQAADGAEPARELLVRILAAGGLAVLPWGVGKWLGSRGRVVAALVQDTALASEPRFFVGDIAARCWPWPTPTAFRRGPRVLPGTDLLPRRGAEAALASYGFSLSASFDPERPAHSLLSRLSDPGIRIEAEGGRESLPTTVWNQIHYRVRGARPGRTP